MPRSSAPSATASSSAAVVMGLAVGIHRSNFTSGPQSSAHEGTDLVGGPGGGDGIGLTRPDRECAVDLLPHEHDGAVRVQVGAEVTGGDARNDEILEHA